ncbi:hypothetical protein [Streptomyces sp. NPDC058295]|uniref:hypothetical protein n=1 Tax=Streptomyces sp. NPDC058295 TaxID=3346431 RepID=UPI0036E76C75
MSERVGHARCSPDQRDLAARGGRMFFDIAATFAEFLSAGRATVCRALERHRDAPVPSTSGGR